MNLELRKEWKGKASYHRDVQTEKISHLQYQVSLQSKFFLWALLSTALNTETVSQYYFKQTSGTTRFIRQFLSLIIAAFILPITFYNSFLNINSKRLIYSIRKVIYYSFVIVIIYSLIEILIVKFNMINLKKPLLNIFDYFPFVEAKTDLRLKRISSVTFEPPALGTYLITIFSWNNSKVLKIINTIEGYEITPYIEFSISVDFHK